MSNRRSQPIGQCLSEPYNDSPPTSLPRTQQYTIVQEGDAARSVPGNALPCIPGGLYSWNEQYGIVTFRLQSISQEQFNPLPVQQQVIDEIDQWIGARDRFREAGLAWKRGWMVTGAPGCGKTSVIRMIIHRCVARGAIVLNVTSMYDLSIAIERALASTRVSNTPVILVMEDVDRFDDDTQVTEVLDGIASNDGIGVIASTNYFDKLSERLTRKGRFDRHIWIEPPSVDEKLKYIHRFGMTDVPDNLETMTMSDVRDFVVTTYILPTPTT